MTVSLFSGNFYTAQDTNGVPLSGAKWYFYEAGAYSVAKDTYTDYAITTPSANPVIADAAGRFDAIYLDGSYAAILKDADDVTIKSILNLNNENDTTANALTGINIQSGTGYTLQLSDANGKVIMTNASANTVTVPPASSVAWVVTTSVLIEQGGAGTTTVVAGSGVTIDTPGTLVADRQHSNMAITYNAADDWTLTGQHSGSLVSSIYESDITAIESDLVIITSDITAIETTHASDLVIIQSDILALETGGTGVTATVGDYLEGTTGAVTGTTQSSYTKLTEQRLPRAGNYRMVMTLTAAEVSSVVVESKARIYVNGSAVGQERTIADAGASPVTWSEDLTSLSDGDLVQVYTLVTSGSSTTDEIATLKIKSSNPPIVAAKDV